MADAPAPDCLLSLLGLSDGLNSCFALPADPVAAAAVTDTRLRPDGVAPGDAGDTGLYLDMAEGLKLQAAAGAPGGPATDLWVRLGKARKLAAIQVRAALEAGRAKSYGVPLYSQRGTLGGLGNGQLMPPGTRAVMRFYTNARREGAWRITRLQLYTDQAVIDAPLLLDGVQVATLTTTTASGWSALHNSATGGLIIPLDGNEHEVEVLLPSTVRVKANKLFPGCFGCSRGTPWALAIVRNLQHVTAETPGNGFALSLVEECTAEPDFLCYATGKDEGQSTFRYPDIARYVAIALLYKAAELFTADLLASNQVSRYTLLEPKMLLALLETYQQKAPEYLAWLNSPDGLGQVQHPCFAGAPVRGIKTEWTL